MRGKRRSKGSSTPTSPENAAHEAADKSAPEQGDETPQDPVKVSGWTERRPKIHHRSFPGGAHGSNQPVRLSFSRDAYAELLAHAKEHLDVEICGVLVGEHCQDNNGDFVSVKGIVRGEAARQSGTHVTFTHDTWNAIHERREQDFPKQEIIGWYHSHPGFGVEWSDMDLFIQKNFFTGFHQVAVVVDPVGGEEAACVSLDGTIKHLSAFWVDGRERRCHLPKRPHEPEDAGAGDNDSQQAQATPAHTHQLDQSVRAMETRLYQLIQEVDEQRRAINRALYTAGFMLCLAVVVVIGYWILTIYRGANLPEKVHFTTVPVEVGDDTYLMGVQVVRWKLPDKLARQYRDRVTKEVITQLEQQLRTLQYQQRLDQAWQESLPPGSSPLQQPAVTPPGQTDAQPPPLPSPVPDSDPQGSTQP